MKTFFRKTLFLLVVFVMGSGLQAQKHYTPYDDIPGIIKEYKPTYENSFPDWAKMLYQSTINYYDITNAYEKDKSLEKNAIHRYFKIWKRAVEPYVTEDGSINIPDLKTYYQDLSTTQKSTGFETRDTANWHFLGPKETFWLNESGSPNEPGSCPWQVNVYSFDVAATDHNILYCGTETGYLNKTTDAGQNWQLLSPEYSFGGGITATAIHPADENTVYVSGGNQVHKSINGGLSWIPLIPANDFYANRLTIDVSSPNKIYASSSNGLFVSMDDGNSWAQKWSGPCWDVVIHPNNSNIIYTITKEGGDFALATSIDGGQTFQQETSFPTGITESSGGLLAVTPDNPDLLFVIMLSSDNTPFLYKGTLSGMNWNWELLATGNTSSFPMNNGQGYFDLVLAVAPDTEDIIFVGTTTLFKSVNAGNNFNAIGGYYGSFSIHPDIQDIKMLPNGICWVATDGGMNLSTDNYSGQQNYHVRTNGIIGSDMWGFDQGWNEDLVVGGRYHNGNTAIADFYQPKALRMGGAESPTGWIVQGRSRYAAFNDLGNGWILPPDAVSAPEGRFMFSKYPNMDEYGGRRGNLLTHPNYYGTFYLGEEEGFWKSTDMGESYELLYSFPNRVRYMQISYSNPEFIYADVVNKGLYKSEDGGYTWTLKPSLTSSPNGSHYWKGKLFFTISPFDENIIYACLQNGTWSSDLGKVFKSIDGGDSWEDWTGSISDYTKCIVVQPSTDSSDIVYLFSTSRGGSTAAVYYRDATMNDWESFDAAYPAGMSVNLALPFFRDGKIRVAGNSGVWESSLKEPEFTPIVNPWVERNFFNCMLDTLYFDDHSIMNHDGVSWSWEIEPTPLWIDDPNARNPRVVLGNPGAYNITLRVNKNGNEYSRTIENMITTTTCPSIDDCSNPAELPKEEWELLYVDSEEVNYPGYAVMSFDGDPETIWHTRWSTGSDPYPHEIQVDLGNTYRIYQFTYLTRQDGQNGRIQDYELYISEDEGNWGDPVATGSWENTSSPQRIDFPDGIVGKAFRLVALSEVNGNAWASAAEFSMVGCTDIAYGFEKPSEHKILAYPMPVNDHLTLSLPAEGNIQYSLYTVNGSLIEHNAVSLIQGQLELNVSALQKGMYVLQIVDQQGTIYKVKVLK